MNNAITIAINIMEVFSFYLLYHGFRQKKASFRFSRLLVLAIGGIFFGIGFIYANTDIVRMLYFLIWFIILLKSSNLRLSDAFILYILILILLILIQTLTLVVTLLPIEDYLIRAFVGESLYLFFVIIVYCKIPISKLLLLAEQNLVFKFIFFIICLGLFVSMIVFDFDADKAFHYILHYIIAGLLSGLGIYETVVIIRIKNVKESQAMYHEHDNIIAGLASLCMTYGNDEVLENVSIFLEDYNKKEYADKLTAVQKNEKDFLITFLKIKQDKASEKEINIIYDITYEENEHVSKTDTIKIIGIMLDNAIEHCDVGKEIFIEIFITEYVFDVEVKNPYKGSAQNLSRIFEKGYSSKKGLLGGYGLSNLWYIINNYNGKVMVQTLGGFITFKVLI